MTRKRSITVILGIGALVLIGFYLSPHRAPKPRMPTITVLPDFPWIPPLGFVLSEAWRNEIIQKVVDNKVSTYPLASARAYRAGKFTTTGIFGGFPPTEEQIARIAPHYDSILFNASQANLISRFKKYNPHLTFFVYVDSGLNPGFEKADAGSVDAENIDWVLAEHPDWILRDKDGNFVRTGDSRVGNKGEYWPDPAHPGWRKYFAEKTVKLIHETGGSWDGVLLDQSFGTVSAYEQYAGARRPVKFDDDKAYQAAQLGFFKEIAAGIRLPVIVNMEGAGIVTRPAFVDEVARAAGGAENEIFPEEMPIEDLRPYLETVENLPPNIHIRINSKPAGIAGDIDRTLFAYYCYLLIADRNREIYWTYKEGTSDVPHYWFKEFDLDLGRPQGKIQFGETLWSRSFENAVVLVNAGKEDGSYAVDPKIPCCDIQGNPVQSPVILKSRTAMLLVKKPSILPR